jgi:CRP-like cAMP-binding protein/CheY-like chemotaxis protein
MDQKTILVVEDNLEMMENIVAILELAHYKTLTAINGTSALGVASRTIPDLIICDVMMPDFDGFGVLHLLRKDPRTANIPFIFLTAKAEKADVRKGMNLGADDYITKPFDGLELLNAVEMRLTKKYIVEADFPSGAQGLNEFFRQAKNIQEFKQLSTNCVLKKYRKKDLIYMEGQRPKEVFLIQSGKVKTYKTSNEGKELILGFHAKGDLIGFTSIIENTESPESAIVIEDCEVCTILKQDFLSLLYTNHDIARKFIKLVVNNLQAAEKRLLALAYHSVRQKVASALLDSYQRIEKNMHGDLLIAVSRKDLSNLIGTATESLNRTLADFKDEGLIDLKDDGILILNKTGIEQLLR